MGQSHSAGTNMSEVNFQIRDDPALLTLIRGKKLEDTINLLASGANPNIRGECGDWAIHVAVKTGHVEFVKLLITFDTDLTVTNGERATPLDVANSNRHWSECAEAIKAVLDLQAEIAAVVPSVETAREAGAKPSGDDIYLLTLDGGGIKGLVFIQVLLGIEKRRKLLYPDAEPFVSYFNWLGGTSTGAMAALAFAGLSLSNPLQQGRGLYLVVKNRILKQSPPYPADKVDLELKNIYGENKKMSSIGHPNVSIMTTMAEVQPIKLHIMSNYGDARDNQKSPDERFIWEAARASSAAVPLFHPFDNVFVDGGFVANNPTIDTIFDILKHKESAKVRAVLSLGCGLVDHTADPRGAPDFPSQHFSFGDLLSVRAPILPWEAKVGIAMVKNPKAALALNEIILAPMTETDVNVEQRSKQLAKLLNAQYYRLDPAIEKINFVEWKDVPIINMMYQAMIGTLQLIRDGDIDRILDNIVGGKAIV